MYKDPIVEEVRKYRQAWAARFGFDIKAMVADLRKREKTSGHVLVDFSKPVRKRRQRPMRKSNSTKTKTGG